MLSLQCKMAGRATYVELPPFPNAHDRTADNGWFPFYTVVVEFESKSIGLKMALKSSRPVSLSWELI